MQRNAGTLLCAALFAVGGPLAGSAEAAVGEHEGAVARGDFNGDGVEDLIVSSPQDDCGRGLVHIRVGTSVSTWSRDTSGLQGTSACDQYFGTALIAGDFDGDGYDDVAISAPGASDPGAARSGSVHVLYGSSSGLSLVGDQIWHQNSTGIKGTSEADDFFGEALASGDFNCDGYDDLAIGVPREDLNAGQDAGAVNVLYGSAGGVSTVDDSWHQNVSGVNGSVEPNDQFGGALAVGNFDGDSSTGIACDDLAIASPGESVGSTPNAGFVYIMDGGTSGLTTVGDQPLHQNKSAIEGAAEADDRFGERLAVSNPNGDAYDDLEVFVPGDACQAAHGTGRHFFPGSPGGIDTSADVLECYSFRCSLDAPLQYYGCPSYADAVYASAGGDEISMFVAADTVWAGGGNDTVTAGRGDDVLFGGPGDDRLTGGPGADLQLGGGGDDVFVVDLGCEAQPGDVIDGGPGSDVVESHLDRAGLVALGVTFNSVETFVSIPEGAGHCSPFPYEEGPFLRPSVTMLWDDLPDANSLSSTTTGEIDLALTNNTATDVDVQLRALLVVRGNIVPFHPPSIAVPGDQTVAYTLDLNDFVPSGTSTSGLPSAFLELPVSAGLFLHGRITTPAGYAGSTSAFPVYGHLENGTTAVLYRSEALQNRYHGGNLLAFRAQQTPVGPGKVQVAAIVPDTP